MHECVVPASDRVPPEIWANTFILGSTPAHEDLKYDGEPGVFPWTISHVCYQWRSIALSTPSLWTSIVVAGYYNDSAEQYVERECRRIEAQIERSDGLPLDIRIVHWFPMPERLLSTIYPHLHRSRSLDVREDRSDRFFRGIPSDTSFPSLREFIWNRFRNNNHAQSPEIQAFRNSPLLHKIALINPLFDNHLLADIPFSQITDLYLAHISKFIVYGILPLLQSVEILRLERIEDPGFPAVIPEFTLPNLRELTLLGGVWAGTSEHSILDGQPCDKYSMGHDYIELNILSRLLNSAANLTLVSTGNLPAMSLRTMHHFLSSMPKVTSLILEFRSPFIQNQWITELAKTVSTDVHDSFPEFCPSLQSINLRFTVTTSPVRIDIKALVAMIRARQPFGLRQVLIRNELVLDNKVKEEDRNAVKRLMGDFDLTFCNIPVSKNRYSLGEEE